MSEALSARHRAGPDFFAGVPAVEASAANGFAGGRIARHSEGRSPAVVAAAVADPAALYYLLDGDRVLLRDGTEPLFSADEAAGRGAEGEPVLLGWQDGTPRLAAHVTAPAEEADGVASVDGIAMQDLRGLAAEARLGPDHLGALALARSLLFWHGRNGFCASCGQRSAMAEGGFRRDCPRCAGAIFPRTDPVVIMLAVDGESCLLGRQPRFRPGSYSCLAGFLEPGESIEEAVRREIGEEAGLTIGRVRYHSSQPWPFPSSLMIGCHAEALSTEIRMDADELEDCRWFRRDEVAAMLAGHHPDGLTTPPKLAIAERLIRAWAEAG